LLQKANKFPSHQLPRESVGAGLKPEHIPEILADIESVGFFEVHAENYMGKGGAPHAALSRIREQHPVFVHGVGLSIGAPGALDMEHLARLKTVVDRYEPAMVSEHLAWSTHDTTYFNDLLAVPYTDDVLDAVVAHLDQVQDFLGRRILLENPSTYVNFEISTMSEIDFIKAVQKCTGCGLLLDINNVFVSATNHGYSAEKYLEQFPLQHVGEIHLAGHAPDIDDQGNTLLIDAHDRPVSQDVWALYEKVISITGAIPTLIEWDNDVPAWPVLKAEARAAARILARLSNAELRHAG
jgi:uncharacterized protein